MKNALLAVFVLGLAGAFGWSQFKPRYPTPMEFTDAAGEKASFPDFHERRIPVVLTFFTDRDGFSPRSLDLLEKLRTQFTADRLAVIAFHVESGDSAALLAMAQSKGYHDSLVATRGSPALGLDLYKTLGLANAGDVAVIDKRGRIAAVISTKDLTQAELEEQVRKAVRKVAGD